MTFKETLVHFFIWWALHGTLIALAIYLDSERALLLGFAGVGVGAQVTIERQRREYKRSMETVGKYIHQLEKRYHERGQQQ